MSTIDTQELLRAYVRDHSDDAFEQLVRSYIDLVYSAALRRVGGATLLAQDVTQIVFTDLARKAASLPADVALGGWLHRHTGFVAASTMRGEQRRRERERQAVEMNALDDPSDQDWKQVAPVLDEAIDQLEPAERDAVVLRFFERRDFRSVGAALGASEDAAQKRVSRALEKLRTLLVQRGVTLSVAGLALALGSRSVGAAPAAWAAGVAKAALAASPTASAGLAAALLKWAAPTTLKLASAAVALIVLVAALIAYHNTARRPSAQTAVASATVAAPNSGSTAPGSGSSTTANQPQAAAAESAPISSNSLHLVIVAADSGKPVPNVQIDCCGWEGQNFSGKTFFANRSGVCDVEVPRATITQLELTTRSDGFADTRLHWQPGSGEVIPASYTLRLARPVAIGGRVLDPDGRPAPGAKVGFNHMDDPATTHSPEDHHFGWIQVSTDTNGQWTINRIAPEMLRLIYGSSSHPDYVQSPLVFANRDRQTEQKLRAGAYTFQLGRAVTVRGIVVDSDGAPVAGANVLVGKRGESNSRKAESGPDGSFVVKGCRPGKSPISAEAQGLAATTIEVELSADSQPVRLTLQRGQTLILRLADQAGQPVANAHVWLDTMHQRAINDPEYGKLAVQADFEGTPDAQGRVVWSNAPDLELTFDIGAPGHTRTNGVKVRPDGQEHLITLSPAAVVSGTVRDASTGELIPRFKIVTGWPTTNFLDHTVSAHWSSFERDRLNFTDGKFQHAFEAPLVFGMANPGYMLRFEADGYAPFTSRPISADETDAHLDVVLRPAADTTVSVLQPDNRPAIHADVGLVMPNAGLQLVPGGFSHMQNGAALVMTDTQGTFRLPVEDTITTVIVAHRSGFAEVTRAALASDPTVHLQPWGRLEGTYLVGGQPATNRDLIFAYGRSYSDAVSAGFEAYRVKTDNAGRFVFEQVPPGKHRLVRLVPTGPNLQEHQPIADVEVRPGETTTVTIGGSGYAITARLHWPDNLEPDNGLRAFASIQTAPPPALAEAAKQATSDPAALARLQQSPEVQEYMRAARHFEAAFSADYQTVSAEQLPAGEYILVINVVRELPQTQRRVAPIAAQTSFTIPANPPSGKLDLGEISVRQPESVKAE